MNELEATLRPKETEQPPYPPKRVVLASGESMIVRQATRQEVPKLLEVLEPLIWVERDYYDIVGARMFSELLGWKRFRVKDEYCLVGVMNGMLVGLVNGRSLSRNIGISLHTMAFHRGLRVGAHLFAAKMEYHIEYLNQREIYVVAESPIGFRRWMIEYALEERRHVAHELGGVMSYALTRDLYFASKDRLVVGERPVSEEMLASTLDFEIPDPDLLVTQVSGRAK
ncbi:MAG: hypothetical protein KAW17_02190 [Candidatus Eisenbacteria sp.]|nr:hypothetical protein [Candidatus Eisenbacteria bacterium]